MQIELMDMELPKNVDANFQEIKEELAAKIKEYEAIVYDRDQYKQAKDDRASLNALKKALNDERIKREKEYMEPFMHFKDQVVELLEMIEKPVKSIGTFIEECELEMRINKSKQIEELFESLEKPDYLDIFSFFKASWLNSTYKLSDIEREMELFITKVSLEEEILSKHKYCAYEAVYIYKKTLDMDKARETAELMYEIAQAKAKKEKAERVNMLTEEDIPEGTKPVKTKKKKKWMKLSVFINGDDFDSFALWASQRNIDWGMQ